MVQAVSYATTYIDGDQGPNYKWTGLRHSSTSTRDSQERGGGRERNFDDYSIDVVEGSQRFGLPPLLHNLQATPLQPGAAYQGSKVLPRELTLEFLLPTGSSGWAGLHSLRKDLIDLLKPDLVRGNQPIVIGYKGVTAAQTRTLYASFRYAGGLEFSGQFGFSEQPEVRLLSIDPYWYEDDRETAALDFTDSLSASGSEAARINGHWQSLGTGLNGVVRALAYDAQRNRIYFGGEFTTGNGVTLNGIGYWNGTTFVAMDGGVTAGAGTRRVRTIAVAPNGDVWVGGDFLQVGAALTATKGLARWNIASDTWTAFNESTATFGAIIAIGIDAGGNVFIGGDFTDWEGDSSSDYVASTSDGGTNWDALGTGMNGMVWAIKVHPDGNVYMGGTFSAGNGVTLNGIGYWSGTTFVPLATGVAGGSGFVYALEVRPDGSVYVGGDFTSAGGVSASNIAVWNGSVFRALGSGVNDVVQSIIYAGDGLLYVGGNFTTAGGLSVNDRLAAWNGYTWLNVDLDATSFVWALLSVGADLYAGFKGSVATSLVAGATTVTTASTTNTFPEVTILGPSSATAVLQWLENQTTGERLYFNLTINTLETIGISCAPLNKRVGSLWGARPTTTRPFYLRSVEIPGYGYSWGEFRGMTYIINRIAGQPLRGSDFSTFHLQAGANTIAAFITGTITGVSMLMHWVPRHMAVDGAAA